MTTRHLADQIGHDAGNSAKPLARLRLARDRDAFDEAARVRVRWGSEDLIRRAVLHDLADDPSERRNAFADSRENMLLHGALIARLKHNLESRNPIRAGAQDEELTAEDLEMLRTLGYIQ